MELLEDYRLNSISFVGTIYNPGMAVKIETVKDSCNIVEIRLDQLYPYSNNPGFYENIKTLSEHLPLIFTARHSAEGGSHALTVHQRKELIAPYLKYASYVDIELDFWEENRPIVDLVKEARVPVIGSSHDFNGPPDMKKLCQTVALGRKHQVAIVKMAVRLHHVEELAALCHFMKEHRDLPLSLMGMGKLGPVSRLLFAQHGSVLNYGFLEKPNAPGQLPVRLMKEILTQLESLP